MKIFLDTADLQSIKKWAATGIISGVTTNPTLLYKAGGDPVTTVREIAALLPDGDISVEVTESDANKIYAQAHAIAKISSNITVKIPCHVDYYAVIQRLLNEGIAINCTLVFSVPQALAMCTLGVNYISPFIGRLDDNKQDGMALVRELRLMIDTYGFTTQLLAASIRSVEHMTASILAGADVATVPEAILEKALAHPLTDRGMQQFLEDWHKLGVKTFP